MKKMSTFKKSRLKYGAAQTTKAALIGFCLCLFAAAQENVFKDWTTSGNIATLTNNAIYGARIYFYKIYSLLKCKTIESAAFANCSTALLAWIIFSKYRRTKKIGEDFERLSHLSK